jgi:hypothetical protein
MERWYVAILVMECQIANQPDGTVDLQVRVIQANSHDQAYEKAQSLGRKAEERYTNVSGDEVAWVFKGLHDLDEIYDGILGDGTEVWSLRTTRAADALVRVKPDLASFWVDANKDRSVRELLGDD